MASLMTSGSHWWKSSLLKAEPIISAANPAAQNPEEAAEEQSSLFVMFVIETGLDRESEIIQIGCTLEGGKSSF